MILGVALRNSSIQFQKKVNTSSPVPEYDSLPHQKKATAKYLNTFMA